jgi:hypothetical protein
MVEDRLRFGPLLSPIGAALLAVSVFLPWYSVSLTAAGVASAQQALNSVAQQFGNTTFEGLASSVGARFNAFAGRSVATLSAHQSLKYISVVLLTLAAIALVAGLLRVAGASESSQAGGSQIALVGIVAILCVLFRMVERPGGQEDVLSLSLSWGSWLALASSAAIVIGALWPTDPSRAAGSTEQSWDKLPPWTPDA